MISRSELFYNMAKGRIPGSSQQELYTVSVESVPQYAARSAQKSSGCCGRRGPAGKDLLCGVLIALAVICAAVAIFLVVYYVVNAGENQATASPGETTDLLNGTHDSSPLTSRHRDDEVPPLNTLGNGNFPWDNKNSDLRDHFSLSSTPLPEVGIHEPESEGHDVYPIGNTKILSQPVSTTTTTEAATTTTTTTTEAATASSEAATSTTEAVLSDDVSPVVEVNSEEITRKNDTSLFVPDDDVVIETPSTSPATPDVSVIRAEESPVSSVAPPAVESSPVTPIVEVPPVETSGFVPVQTIVAELETEAQTEAAPEIPARPDGTLAVDNTPWKPIDADNSQDPVASVEPKVTSAPPSSVAPSTEASPSVSDTASSSSPPPPETSSPVPDDEPASEFDGSMQDLGNLAFLIPPEVRNRSSTPVTNEAVVNAAPAPAPGTASSNQCIKRDLEFCRGVLPYSETALPNLVGDINEVQRNLSVPYFDILTETECNERIQQYACAVLEPPCRGNGISLPPCRQFCRAIAEDCGKYVLAAAHISRVFDCDQFPQSNDPSVCLNLASTTPEGECLDGEYRCLKDNTCIPERWVCDGEDNCSQGDDEASCSAVCRDDEFKCEAENRCLPKRWKCDGSSDCADGSDERDCAANRGCGDGQFKCNDGSSCIPLRWVCDGTNNCLDNSDETNCTSIVCLNDDFKCRDNGICIPNKWVCDRNADCKDGSDELGCPTPGAERNGELVEDYDLDNGTSLLDPATLGANCPQGKLLCMSDLSCIRFEQFCDGTKDCSDGADEANCFGEEEEDEATE